MGSAVLVASGLALNVWGELLGFVGLLLLCPVARRANRDGPASGSLWICPCTDSSEARVAGQEGV